MSILKRTLVIIVVLAISLTAVSASFAQGPDGNGRPQRAPGERTPAQLIGLAVIHETAVATETDARDVIQARLEGQSINDYLAEHGVDASVVTTNVLTMVQERLNQAVENERLTQAELDEIMATIETELADAMASTDPIEFEGRPDRDGQNHPIANDIVEMASEATGLEPRAILADLMAGQTLSEILEANGVDVATFSAELTTYLTDKITQAVADEKIPAERAAELISNLPDHIDTLLNHEFEGQRDGRRGRGLGDNDSASTGVLE